MSGSNPARKSASSGATGSRGAASCGLSSGGETDSSRSLAVRSVGQSYRRIDERSYRYASGSFAADVVFGEDDLVTDYVGLWQRVPIDAPA